MHKDLFSLQYFKLFCLNFLQIYYQFTSNIYTNLGLKLFGHFCFA